MATAQTGQRIALQDPPAEHARRTGEESDIARRVLGTVNVFRMLVALSLLAIFFASDPHIFGDTHPALFSATAAGYLVFSALSGVAMRYRWVSVATQTYVQLAIDIVAVSLLMHASGGIDSGLGGLLVIFVGASGLSLPGRTPLFFAALAALAVLFEQFLTRVEHGTGADQFPAAGVLGALIFGIALAARPLARRMQESEALARQRGVDLANLSQLNRYIVQHLRESILVVDEDNRVRLMNESAAHLLGCDETIRDEPLASVSPELAQHVAAWRKLDVDGAPPEFAMLAPDGSSRISVHLAPFAREGGGERGPLLVFLEDTSELAERVQQSKLASLGRLSASIAHEIRNPVGAMSHAGQLLAESAAIGEEEQRLVEIILNHSERVNLIVENVLQLSRRDSGQPSRFMLEPWLVRFVDDFAREHELREGEIVLRPGEEADDDSSAGGSAEDAEVRMDRGHLRQVLWNLCENAVKYGSEAGGITVEIRTGRIRPSRRPYLEVLDRGHGVAPEMADKIFEPFFTDRQGGTGLGLYISRELCELNRATLTYRPREGGGSAFRIVFADPNRWNVDDD